jgi:hypothetical protein
MRTTARAGMALVVALTALAVGGGPAPASEQDCASTGCVLLIEVDGLEPGDVSRERTPFLWALAHPNEAIGDEDVQDAIGAAASELLGDRRGFTWQAPRAPMTAGTAPSAVTLLTGANPDVHGVLADEMLDVESDPAAPPVRRLRAREDQGGGVAEPLDGISSRATSLFDLVSNESPAPRPTVASFIGDPALANLLAQEVVERDALDRRWSPTVESGSDPSLCPLPRAAPVSQGSGSAGEAQGAATRDCPSRDATTLNNAFQSLTANTKTPVLTYVQLAELGRIKQLLGEPEAASTLARVDAELAAFFAGLTHHINTSAGFEKTLVVVTGNHGYEPTPLAQRVPHPTDAGKDFAAFVKERSARDEARFVGQGTIGTVYWQGATAQEIEALAADIEGACDCIEEVVPVASLAELHATWHLNPLTLDEVPSGAGGQLLVTTTPGWAFGRATPGEAPEDASDEEKYAAEASNPYLASAGGPRNRAVALIMNGPRTGVPHTVRQVENGQMWVKPGADPLCDKAEGVDDATANDPATMADDADARGHECQPETVDVALSLAAMLEVPLGAQQAPQARFLDEAFTPPLGGGDPVEEEEPIEPEPPPPPPPEPIVIRSGGVRVVPPRPPVDPFPYRGLVRRIRVAVTDSLGRRFVKAKRGARLSSIRVRADFGRPQSLVTLTFYKRLRRPSGRPGGRLFAIARFKPFLVKRGPVELKLRIPSQFRPTHLGVSVREVQDGAPTGRPGGGIAQIADATRLHTVKKGRTPRRRARS